MESKKLECSVIVNRHNMCRSCLGDEAFVNIFDNTERILDKILACCAVQVEKEDGLPPHICNTCISKLENAYDFRSKCEENDKTLRRMIVKKEIKPEPKSEHPLNEFETSETDSSTYENLHNETQNFNDIDYGDSTNSNNDFYISPKNESNILVIKRQKNICNKSYIKAKVVPRTCVRGKTKVKFENMTKNEGETEEVEIKPDISDLVYENESRKKKSNKEVKIEEENILLCSFCGKIFTCLSHLRKHLEIHTDNEEVECDICNKIVKGKSRLTSHKRIHSLGSYPCEVCGKIFAHKESVKKHINSVHMRLKAKPCPLCDKMLATPASYKSHMLIHSGARNYECKICLETFVHKISFVCHTRTHTGEKPYGCRFCESKFSTLKSKVEHERLHTGEKPYQCPLCNKAFAQKGNMRSHFRFRHKTEKWIR